MNKNINTVFFDLDATLLQMDQDEFVKEYISACIEKCKQNNLDSEKLVKTIWGATEAMVLNDGTMTNEERFYRFIKQYYQNKTEKIFEIFGDFYDHEFHEVSKVVHKSNISKEIVTELNKQGYTIVLATNPVFPRKATYERMRWASLSVTDFKLVTTYENSTYCKPNINYYIEILNKIGKKPEETIMVGNDVDEDMVASKIGMDTFLVTDFLLNRHNLDKSVYKSGTLKDFLTSIRRPS